jgi:hypothetical protein
MSSKPTDTGAILPVVMAAAGSSFRSSTASTAETPKSLALRAVDTEAPMASPQSGTRTWKSPISCGPMESGSSPGGYMVSLILQVRRE